MLLSLLAVLETVLMTKENKNKLIGNSCNTIYFYLVCLYAPGSALSICLSVNLVCNFLSVQGVMFIFGMNIHLVNHFQFKYM